MSKPYTELPETPKLLAGAASSGLLLGGPQTVPYFANTTEDMEWLSQHSITNYIIIESGLYEDNSQTPSFMAKYDTPVKVRTDWNNVSYEHLYGGNTDENAQMPVELQWTLIVNGTNTELPTQEVDDSMQGVGPPAISLLLSDYFEGQADDYAQVVSLLCTAVFVPSADAAEEYDFAPIEFWVVPTYDPNSANPGPYKIIN